MSDQIPTLAESPNGNGAAPAMAGISTAVEPGTVAVLQSAEIDSQIATAKRYPRDVDAFRDQARKMATINEAVARGCVYALPRDGKFIEGPSARFAEIMISAWGNCRAGARIIGQDGQFITAQGVFHDLERNVAITFDVRRRITNRQGKTYSADMIAVTGNAAASIALRNATLRGIPGALWNDIYEATREAIKGDEATVEERRKVALTIFNDKYGIESKTVFDLLDVGGAKDIGQEELVSLRGILAALNDGEVTVENLLRDAGVEVKPKKSTKKKAAAKKTAAETKPESEPDGTAAETTETATSEETEPETEPDPVPAEDEDDPTAGMFDD